jgi:hypothetical protein
MERVQGLVLLTNGIFGVDARTIHVALLDRLWSSKGQSISLHEGWPSTDAEENQMKGAGTSLSFNLFCFSRFSQCLDSRCICLDVHFKLNSCSADELNQ